MTISRNNYEAYFLDYYEGNLSEAQVGQLMAFLEEHQDFKEEFESFELWELDDDTLPSFPNKESLKKNALLINDTTIDEYCIAALEGDLSEDEYDQFIKILDQNPRWKSFFETYQKTILQTDSERVFFQKNLIKKETIGKGDSKSSDDLDDLCIAYMEGDLSHGQAKEFESLRKQNPRVAQKISLYEAGRLHADDEVIYPNKLELKRFTIGYMITVAKPYLSMAAAVLFFASVLWLVNPTQESDDLLAERVVPLEKESFEKIDNAELKTLAHQNELEEEAGKTMETLVIQKENLPVKKDQPLPQQTLPKPFEVATLEPIRNANLATAVQSVQIEYKDEYMYYFDALRNQEGEEDIYLADLDQDFSQENERELVSLVSLAQRGVEQITGVNVDDVTEDIASGRWGLWDWAGLGLAGLSQVSGNSLAVEKQRDENGRLTTFAIGNMFRIER